MKTFKDQLQEISRTKSPELVVEFEERIKGHTEEKMLQECVNEAKCGNTYINLGRNCCPPQILNKEGFKLKVVGTRLIYSWE